MRSTSFTYTARDGKELSATSWLPERRPLGIVQIVHGLGEHRGRYERLARALCAAGFAVYAEDHRGHGETAGSVEALGFFADSGGWDLVVDDLRRLSERARSENPGVALFLLGHSMGSFLARSYIALHGRDLSGVVLSGTSGDPGLLGAVGRRLAAREVKKLGPRVKSPLLNRIAFGGYNRRFRPHRTQFDWLSRDGAVVDAYVADPFCGAVPTTSFFADLLEGLRRISDRESFRKTPPELPVYLFSGRLDPVGAYGRGVRQVARRYRRAGVRDVSLRLYDDCRHECLNELNRDEVTAELIAWLSARSPAR